ncbi:18311_t:CDS:2 [Funneliformis geosporum]|nr:18311_t:CDS:2 [Funneliformis geosporum]
MNCLDNILLQLKDDLCSLYSCLLVNRDWCRLVIPLLWSQPFELAKETSSHNIVRTYISCLPKESKKRFRIGGIKLPDFTTTLFDYPTFLQKFDTQKFCQALNRCLQQNSPQYFYATKSRNKFNQMIRKQIKLFKGFYIINPKNNLDKAINKCFKPLLKKYYSTNPSPCMAKEILYLLFNECDSLKYLIINSCLDNKYKMDIRLHLFTQGHHNSFQKLHTFDIDFVKRLRYNRDWKREDTLLIELLNKMSQFAIHLKEIRIEIPRDLRNPWEEQHLTSKFHRSLCKLIESQKSLYRFTSNYYWDQSEISLYKSLTSQSHSLSHLTLMELIHSDYYLRDGLASWKNLGTLELLGGSDFLTPSNIELDQLSIINLFVGHNYEPDPLIPKILKATNINLRKLILDGSSNPRIFDSIKTSCSQITHLSISFLLDNYNYIISLLSNLLSDLHQLKYLKLSSREINDTSIIFESLLKLSKSLPLYLQHLVLEFNMHYLSLDYFLKQCHHLINLDIIYNSNNIKDELFFTLIQYKKDNINCNKIRFISPYNLDLDSLDNASEFITFVQEKNFNLNIHDICNIVTDSSVLNKRHGPFTPCAGKYPNQMDIILSPNILVFGQNAIITLTGTSSVTIFQGAQYEIAIDRDDNTSILNSSFDLCANVGTHCPLPVGNVVLRVSFPMPLASPEVQDGKNHLYSMAFSSNYFLFI